MTMTTQLNTNQLTRLVEYKAKYTELLQIIRGECCAKVLQQLRQCSSSFLLYETVDLHVGLETTEMTVAPNKIGRMNYENFFEIVKRHRIIYQNWPVTKFCTPAKLSVEELYTFHSVVQSENAPTLFRRITDEEYKTIEINMREGNDLALPSATTTPVLPTPLTLAGPRNPAACGSGSSDNDGITDPPVDPTAPTDDMAHTDPTTPTAHSQQDHLGDQNPGDEGPGPRGGTLVTFDGRKVYLNQKPRKQQKKATEEEKKQRAAQRRQRAAEKKKAQAAAVAADIEE